MLVFGLGAVIRRVSHKRQLWAGSDGTLGGDQACSVAVPPLDRIEPIAGALSITAVDLLRAPPKLSRTTP